MLNKTALITLLLHFTIAKYMMLCDGFLVPRLLEAKSYVIKDAPTAPMHTRGRFIGLYSHTSNTPYTELEYLIMKGRVLAISSQEDDEKRRLLVSEWIKAHSYNKTEGVRQIHLFDLTVIQLGEEYQKKLRRLSLEHVKKPCSETKTSKERDYEHKRTMWAFVDMLVQTKAMMNKLGIPKRTKSRIAFQHQRKIHKCSMQPNLNSCSTEEGESA